MAMRPNLFSSSAVFISPEELEMMTSVINAIELTIQNNQYQQLVLEQSPPVAKINRGPKGVFMGYDFHLTPDGPKLIEINTNAGGGLLNVMLAMTHETCLQDQKMFFKSSTELPAMGDEFVEMFKNEWRIQRGNQDLKFLAIVDDNPQEQFLYPEFLLFQDLFRSHGIETVIIDPNELNLNDDMLLYQGKRIDYIYNRLTDFYLEEKTHETLRLAYERDLIVLTPSPFHFALYANKLNLIHLCQKESLNKMMVPTEISDTLVTGIPATVEVNTASASELWIKRRHLFFKPIKGYGSKATYRGDKITHKVWDVLLHSKYVAQTLTPAGKKTIINNAEQVELKFDVRVYVYDGKVQLLAARLYEGQTTNFRTVGGGFAPVFVLK